MKYIILVLVSFLTVSQQKAQSIPYITQLGKSVIIHSDDSYDLAVKENETASAEDLSPFEMPSKDNYIIDDEELKSIRNLESDANNREIKYYIKYLRLKEQVDTLTQEGAKDNLNEQLESVEDKLDQAKSVSKQIMNLRKIDAEEREKAYENIFDDINNLEDRQSTFFELSSNEKKVKLRSDTRTPYEIIGSDDCTLVFDGFDEKLDTKRKETMAMHLFGHTHPRLQRHFKEGDYLNTKASLAKIDGDYYLILLIDVASKSASSNYGSIPPTEKARIRFVDGSTIYCKPINSSTGSLQEYTGHTIYNPIFKIDKSDVNLMKKIEVDDIGIMWSSGFENYEIYDVDVLQKLATCLKK